MSLVEGLKNAVIVVVSVVDIFLSDNLSCSLVPTWVFVAAAVVIAPCFPGVLPSGVGHHILERVDLDICPVSGGDVNELFRVPGGGVDHVLETPVYLIFPPADHFPIVIGNLVVDLTGLEVVSSLFVERVSGECSPVLDVLFVDEVLAPSGSVVGSPGLSRLVGFNTALVELVSEEANFSS